MPRQAVPCLICSQTMQKVRVAGNVEVDVCDTHGVWLDRGELESIVNHHERARAADQPSMLGRAGSILASSAASGAGFGIGSAVASSLIRRLLG